MLVEHNLDVEHPIVLGAIQRTFLPAIRAAVERYRLFWNQHSKAGDTLSPGAWFLRDLPATVRPEEEEASLERSLSLSLLSLSGPSSILTSVQCYRCLQGHGPRQGLPGTR
jgi:hypothetical protein